MTIDKLEEMRRDFIQAIAQYRTEKDYNEEDLELLLDRILCDMPRDMVYIEWFNRSQIKDMADSQFNNDEASEDIIDSCMFDLWDNTNSMMDSDSIYSSVAETIRNNKEGASYED